MAPPSTIATATTRLRYIMAFSMDIMLLSSIRTVEGTQLLMLSTQCYHRMLLVRCCKCCIAVLVLFLFGGRGQHRVFFYCFFSLAFRRWRIVLAASQRVFCNRPRSSGIRTVAYLLFSCLF